MKKLTVITLSLLALTGWLSAPVFAAPEKGAIEVKNVAEIEKEVKTTDGKVEKKRELIKHAPPGTEVIYTTTFTNISSKPAGNIVLDNPVPKDTTLVAGSVFGQNTDISYSVDGGKKFDRAENLRVKTAEGRERPATSADYTTLRWSYKGDLAPGQRGEVGFRAVIK
jgi:uncharacterized repeat protein (TIGR01451 family)